MSKNFTKRTTTFFAAIILLVVSFLVLKMLFQPTYQSLYRTEVQHRLSPVFNQSILSEKDFRHLPKAVQKYIEYTGNIGKPPVKNIRVITDGQMKLKEDADWMNIHAQQYNFFTNSPARFYYISSSMYGLPLDGLHAYTENSASMKIKIAGLFQVVDAVGQKMDQSETVTVFNEMCLFAPSTLVNPQIRWKELNENTVEATYTTVNHAVTAKLLFDDNGALINFISNDRYMSADGKTFENYPWSTPIKDYQEFEGRKIATYGEAIWQKPQKNYIYAKFNIKNISYNTTEFK